MKNMLFLLLGFLLMGFGACHNSDVESEPDDPSSLPTAIESANPGALVPTVHSATTYQVTVTKGIVYAEGLVHKDWESDATETIPLLLDIYQPEGAPANRPAIILIHGGGFSQGSRNNAPLVTMAKFFASHGWVCFSIDYRLEADHGSVPVEWKEVVNQSTYTDQQKSGMMAMYPAARDAKAAVRWLYANAETYQVNTNFITVGGSSAGAYLSIMLGVTEPEDYRDELNIEEDPTLESTNLDQPAVIHTIIDLWGADGLIKMLEWIGLANHFDRKDAPILVVHGTADQTVNYNRAEEIVTAYEETGAHYKFIPLEGAPHSAWDAVSDGKSLNVLAFDFIVAQQGLVVVE